MYDVKYKNITHILKLFTILKPRGS